MENVKIFSGWTGDLKPIENNINSWLEENANKIEIIRVLQSSLRLDIFITIFYKKID